MIVFSSVLITQSLGDRTLPSHTPSYKSSTREAFCSNACVFRLIPTTDSCLNGPEYERSTENVFVPFIFKRLNNHVGYFKGGNKKKVIENM